MDSLSCEPLTGCMNNSLRSIGKTHAIGSVKYPIATTYFYLVTCATDRIFFLPFRENLAIIEYVPLLVIKKCSSHGRPSCYGSNALACTLTMASQTVHTYMCMWLIT